VISLLGRALVLLALSACTIGAVTGIVAGLYRGKSAERWTRGMAYLFGGSTLAATLLMEFALLSHDFSVSYVAQVGSRSTPTWVTVVSLWSALEGSILLWSLVLGAYTALFAWYTRDRFEELTPYALGVTMAVGAFFCFLVAGIANPFAPSLVVPLDGPGPNALLQNHILMVVHPPTLYLGYVGMSVPFAMACAALLAGRLDVAWMRALRLWTLLPWGLLGFGIVLGGWWSYEVLGWGGAWAWDPVENASFMPWLTGTAFLHSALLMERRDQLKGWALSLIMATFLLTLLGTFMTRSGVFNSVHSFTQSPIGPVFLGFLGIALVFSVILLAARIDRLVPATEGLDGPLSRDMAFLGQNLLFVAFTFTVLLGTTWPLVNEALTDTRISVGEPYFDRMAIPIGLAILFLMGVGPALPWGRVSVRQVAERLAMPVAGAVVVAAVLVALGWTRPAPLATFAMAAFVVVTTVRELIEPARARATATGEALPRAFAGVAVRARRRFGGYIVHLGVIMVIVGLAASKGYRSERDLTFEKGQSVEFDGYTLTFIESQDGSDPHRRFTATRVGVSRDGTSLGELVPRLNHYASMNQPIPTPAVRSTLAEDLYLSLVAVDPAGQTVSIEAIREPLVAWMWLGGVTMLLGTVVAAWPSRRRQAAVAAAPASKHEPAVALPEASAS
jgi:cytochrome c-type biogenesis protein CcmF